MNALLNYPGAKWGMAQEIVALMPRQENMFEEEYRMMEAIIWFLLGYVAGGVVGILVMAVVAANKEKREDG